LEGRSVLRKGRGRPWGGSTEEKPAPTEEPPPEKPEEPPPEGEKTELEGQLERSIQQRKASGAKETQVTEAPAEDTPAKSPEAQTEEQRLGSMTQEEFAKVWPTLDPELVKRLQERFKVKAEWSEPTRMQRLWNRLGYDTRRRQLRTEEGLGAQFNPFAAMRSAKGFVAE